MYPKNVIHLAIFIFQPRYYGDVIHHLATLFFNPTIPCLDNMAWSCLEIWNLTHPFQKKKRHPGPASQNLQKKNVFPRFVCPGSYPENLPTPTTSHTRAVLDWLKPHSIFAEQKTEIKWNQTTPQWKSVKWLQYETMALDYFSSWNPKDQQNTTPLWPSRSLHPSPHSRVILETKSANIPGTYWNVGSWEIVVNQVGFCFALRFFSKTTKNSCDF